jgi:hypothetical protein
MKTKTHIVPTSRGLSLEAIACAETKLNLGSLSSRHGSMITIDELCMDTPTPIDAMRQALAAMHGVPVDQVQLQGTHEEGRMIVGDFVVNRPREEYTAGSPCPVCGGDLVPSVRLSALLNCNRCQESFCITVKGGLCKVTS